MPTKSLEAQISARGVLGNFPRFGKLRKGAEKTEKGAGRDQNHFRLTLETPYEDSIRPAFEQLFGTEPDTFENVLLAADSADQAFQYWNEQWAHARLLKRCDEETIHVHWNDNVADYSIEPLACTCNPLDRACKPHGRLDIVIPALFELTGEWGKFTVETTSIYDVVALRSYMKMADAFMQKLPGVAFWSVPFTIGRALRTVPVTINGKRSLKPMSLLYAKIEPSFNQQVFTPMLTRPAQMLLAGGEIETEPELEVEFTQAASWDRDYVKGETLFLFDHENHWDNAIRFLIDTGKITDDMSDEQVLGIISDDRAARKEEKEAEARAKNASKSRQKGSKPSAVGAPALSDLEWTQDAKIIGVFVSQAHLSLQMDMSNVIDALNWCSVDPIQNVQDFDGTKETAWAACVLYKSGYNPETLAQYIPDASNPVRLKAETLLKQFEMPF